jgi:hypothetical protein
VILQSLIDITMDIVLRVCEINFVAFQNGFIGFESHEVCRIVLESMSASSRDTAILVTVFRLVSLVTFDTA